MLDEHFNILPSLAAPKSDHVRPANVPPLATYFVDYDDKFDDAAARGHMGDIAILRICGQGAGIVPAVDAGAGAAILIGGFCRLDQIRLPSGECCERRWVRQGRCCPPAASVPTAAIGVMPPRYGPV